MTYIHTPQTDVREKENVNAAGKAIEKENNRPAVVIMVKRFEVAQSAFAYEDKEKNPNFKLNLTDAHLVLTNYSNHEEQGPAHVTLDGKFMGSGATTLDGTFLAEKRGPQFDMNLAIKNTDMTAMDELLLAFGRFDVKHGEFTVYSELAVKDGNISGYVKPMFSDLTVYDWSQDKHKPVLHQAYEAVVGGAAHVFKNSQTKQVATVVSLTGKLKNPNTSTWQAVVEVSGICLHSGDSAGIRSGGADGEESDPATASTAGAVEETRPSRLRATIDFSEHPRMVVQAAIGRFIDNNDLLWASALTYTTALSIVPLLVLVFSILKGLGGIHRSARAGDCAVRRLSRHFRAATWFCPQHEGRWGQVWSAQSP